MKVYSPLVGVNFRTVEAKEIVRNLEIGDDLTLVVEPTNPYDDHAVKVIEPKSNEFVGYLSRECNTETFEHLSLGRPYTCTVVSFLATLKPHLEIELHGFDE